MARAALGIGVREIAKLAGVSPSTVARLEAEKEVIRESTVDAIRSAFEKQGIVFIGSTGVEFAAPELSTSHPGSA